MVHKKTKFMATVSMGLFLSSLTTFSLFSVFIEHKKEVLADERTHVDEARAQTDMLKTLVATLGETKELRENLSKRIIYEKDVISVLNDIESLGASGLVKVKTNNITKSAFDERFELYHVNIAITGPYEAVLRAARLLELLPYQSKVTGIRLTQSEEGDEEVWTAEVELQITKYREGV